MTEKITVNGKEYTVKLLFGDEKVSSEDFCIDDTNKQRWRNFHFVASHNYTAKHFLKDREYKKVGRLIQRKNIG